MCLIALDWQQYDDESNSRRRRHRRRLIVASNRDEYYDRPSQDAHFWKKKNDNDNDNSNDDNNNDGISIYAGRDSRSGGTWLACSTSSSSSLPRFATVTNFHSLESRLGQEQPRYPKSRGDLVANFFRCCNNDNNKTKKNEGSDGGKNNPTVDVETSCQKDDNSNDSNDNTDVSSSSSSSSVLPSAYEYCQQQIKANHDQYGGFGAFFMDGTDLYFCTNRKINTTLTTTTESPKYEFVFQQLSSGTYGLSNHLLDTPWPKTINVKEGLQRGIQEYYYYNNNNNDDNDDDDDYEDNENENEQRRRHQQLATYLLNEKVMENTNRVDDRSLLPTTLVEEEEYIRSSIFVQGPTFGTRTTTIVSMTSCYHNDSDEGGSGGFHVTEKNHVTPCVEKASISYQYVK